MTPNVTWIEPEEEEDAGIEPNRLHEFPMGIDGPVLYIRRSQPHGFLEFATEKGPVPKELVGQWTALDMAVLAGKTYINKTVSPVKFNPKGEPAKIKNVPKEAKAV